MRPDRRCRVVGCRFAATGVMTVRSARSSRVEHRFGICAVHRDDVANEAITSGSIESVAWEPITGWADDGTPLERPA